MTIDAMKRLLALAMTISCLLLQMGPVVADSVAATCAPTDLDKLFSRSYYGASWVGLGGGTNKTVTWNATDVVVDTKRVTRPLTVAQLDQLQTAFDAWDMALNSVQFKQVRNSSSDITVGWTGTNDTAGFNYTYNFNWYTDRKQMSTAFIQFAGNPNVTDAQFLDLALSAIGNAIGMGFISGSGSVDSAVEENAGVLHRTITDLDRRVIRQIYTEEICTIDDRFALRISALEQSLAALEAQLSDLQDENSTYADQLAALRAKLAKICKARPKPKGC